MVDDNNYWNQYKGYEWKYTLNWLYYGLIFKDKAEESMLKAVDCVLTEEYYKYISWYLKKRVSIDNLDAIDVGYFQRFEQLLIEKFLKIEKLTMHSRDSQTVHITI